MSAESELTRRWVHFLVGGLALLLPFLEWRLALLVTLFFLFLNAELLPRTTVGKRLFRPREGWAGGIIQYPLTIAILILCFRHSTLPICCGWLALAWGDPAAAFIGNQYPLAPLTWNSSKSWGGTIAFFIAAVIAIALACTLHDIEPATSFLFATCGALTGALVESLRWPIADNLPLGLSVSAMIAFLGAMVS